MMLTEKALHITLMFILTFFLASCSTVHQNPDTKALNGSSNPKLITSEIQSLIKASTIKITSVQETPIVKTGKYEAGDQISANRTYDERLVKEIGSGIGFLIEDGLVITNYHVVDFDNVDYFITFTDQTEHEAKLLTSDQKIDLAVLRITDASEIPVLQLGDSDNLSIGQIVLSNENKGVITALNYNLTVNSLTLSSLIQTDIPVIAGDSGTPLVNIYGEVIGINTAFSVVSENEGYAIPVNALKEIVEGVKK